MVLRPTLKDRDVVFVPVAITMTGYWRIASLSPADEGGTRRFRRAKISVILKFIVRKVWLRMRGKFLRLRRGRGGVWHARCIFRDYGAPNVDGNRAGT